MPNVGRALGFAGTRSCGASRLFKPGTYAIRCLHHSHGNCKPSASAGVEAAQKCPSVVVGGLAHPAGANECEPNDRNEEIDSRKQRVTRVLGDPG